MELVDYHLCVLEFLTDSLLESQRHVASDDAYFVRNPAVKGEIFREGIDRRGILSVHNENDLLFF